MSRAERTVATLLAGAALLLLLGVMPFLAWGNGLACCGDFTPREYGYLPVVFYMEPLPTSTPSATPTTPPAPTATSTIVSSAPWLSHVNSYRSVASLPTVAENGDWSYGDWLHARYMVKNDYVGHSEEPGNPWYTPEGAAAASSSNVMVSSSTSSTDEFAIKLWMGAPFHAIAILDPALQQVGFGSYREAVGYWQMGAALDVLRGLGPVPPSLTFPVAYPSGTVIIPLSYRRGTEWPEPLTSCPSFGETSGSPLLLQIGPGDLVPGVSSHSLLRNGAPLDHCIFDETSYINPDSGTQYVGRSILNMRDAIVLIPRDPLVPGSTYTASITANGQSHSWTFTIAAAAHVEESATPAEVR
ncbi:MAG: CAP domain-containing protein [Ardenticatenaceae bacterium]